MSEPAYPGHTYLSSGAVLIVDTSSVHTLGKYDVVISHLSTK